jgi:hypothetical protein
VFAYPDISFQLYGKVLARTTGALLLGLTEAAPQKISDRFFSYGNIAAYTPVIFWMSGVI